VKRQWIVGMVMLLAACTAPVTPVTKSTRQPQPQQQPAKPTARPMRRATKTPRPRPTAAPPTKAPTMAPTMSPSPTPSGEVGGGGAALSSLQVGQPVDIQRIHMVDLNRGWAIGTQPDVPGEHILRTEDGGLTWKEVTPPVGAEVADSEAIAFFRDDRTAWVVYSVPPPMAGVETVPLWLTTDGGASWKIAPLEVGTGDFFSGGRFAVDGADVWLLVTVGAGMQHAYSNLYHSSDGGQTWELLADPFTPGAEDLMLLPHTGMDFQGGTGWVTKENGVAEGGFLIVSTDGGASWRSQELFPTGYTPGETNGLFCNTYAPQVAMRALLMNCDDFGSGIQQGFFVLLSGAEPQYYLLPALYTQMIPVDARTVLLFGKPPAEDAPSSVIERLTSTSPRWDSIDGIAWEPVKTVNWDGDFFFLDANHGWAVARNGDEIALVYTEDGGRSWSILKPVVAP